MKLIGLSTWYGRKQVLHDIDIDLPTHGCLVILGPSGTGKSSLLQSIHALAGHGKLHASDGHCHTRLSARPQAQAIASALMTQKTVRPSGSVLQYLHSGLAPPGQAQVAVLKTWLQGLHLHQLLAALEQPLALLSPGDWALLRIARSAQQSQSLLLLDEPTAGLDEPIAATIRALIQLLSQTQPILLVTHHLGEAQQLAQQVLLISDGRVQAHQSAQQFFHAPSSGAAKYFLQHGTLAERVPTEPALKAAAFNALLAIALSPLQSTTPPRTQRQPDGLHWIVPHHLALVRPTGESPSQLPAMHRLHSLGINALLTLTATPHNGPAAHECGIHTLTYPIVCQPPIELGSCLDLCALLDALLEQGSSMALYCPASANSAATILAMYVLWRTQGQREAQSTIAALQHLHGELPLTPAQHDFLAHFFNFIATDVVFTD